MVTRLNNKVQRDSNLRGERLGKLRVGELLKDIAHRRSLDRYTHSLDTTTTSDLLQTLYDSAPSTSSMQPRRDSAAPRGTRFPLRPLQRSYAFHGNAPSPGTHILPPPTPLTREEWDEVPPLIHQVHWDVDSSALNPDRSNLPLSPPSHHSLVDREERAVIPTQPRTAPRRWYRTQYRDAMYVEPANRDDQVSVEACIDGDRHPHMSSQLRGAMTEGNGRSLGGNPSGSWIELEILPGAFPRRNAVSVGSQYTGNLLGQSPPPDHATSEPVSMTWTAPDGMELFPGRNRTNGRIEREEVLAGSWLRNVG
ncbi:hypothetical protein K505DRAFT_88469 [Melanomma pulvis-pyrius CBS 109.77]|uniref:Uncharacterized protein n=1 Tax=Melanomma pulvis-pyrius CBS 109.77 TaxID=1314802 RepID=A0A6A6X1R9_9PLEO|nr:hypothetical protein K505DRAFT_88469 [Melanomma pulvis-pyrius CBS 109.77]